MRGLDGRPVLAAGVVALWLSSSFGAESLSAGPREMPGGQPGTRPATGTGATGSTKSGGPTPGPTPTRRISDADLEKMPDDATGYCDDGTWTSSVTKQGSCSGHGGVAVWFGPPKKGVTGRCKDGTYTKAKEGTGGACSSHGGLKFWKSQAKPAASQGG